MDTVNLLAIFVMLENPYSISTFPIFSRLPTFIHFYIAVMKYISKNENSMYTSFMADTLIQKELRALLKGPIVVIWQCWDLNSQLSDQKSNILTQLTVERETSTHDTHFLSFPLSLPLSVQLYKPLFSSKKRKNRHRKEERKTENTY